jgi:hypothetical protein
MADVNSILAEQLAEAHALGDRPRQIALAVALLKERGADTVHLQRLIAKAAAELIAIHEEVDLEAASGWAQTWHRHTRQASAKTLWQELQGRAAAMHAAEIRVRSALVGGDPGALHAALTDLEQLPGRLTTTAALIEEARASLSRSQTHVRRQLTDRLAKTDVMRRRLDALVPGSLDLAIALLPQFYEIDLTSAEDPQLQMLSVRHEAVLALHQALEAALTSRSLPDLEQALSALTGSEDRVTSSAELIDRAIEECSVRRGLYESQLQICRDVDRNQIDAALEAFTELAVIAPDAPHLGELPALRTEHARLTALHRQLEAGIANPRRTGIDAAIAQLRSSPTHFADSAELADRAAQVLGSFRSHRTRMLGLAIAGGVIVVLGATCFGSAWWHDARAHAAVLAAKDEQQALDLTQAYLADWTHLFYKAEMRDRRSALAVSIDDHDFAAATAPADATTRLASLDRYLAHASSRHLAEAHKARDAAHLEIEDHAFEVANAVADPAQRIKALDGYIAAATVAERATQARARVADLRRARNEAAWTSVRVAPDAVAQIAAIAAYLALDGELAHADEAVRLRAACEGVLARQREEMQDDAAWAAATRSDDTAALMANLKAYIAGKTLKRHGEAAGRRLAQLGQKLDDDAFHAASTAPDPLQRTELLSRYIAGDTLRLHLADAQSALADARWAAASAPAGTMERLVHVRAYLADPVNQAHRADAVKLERDLIVALDREEWDKARLIKDYVGRIRAIDAYCAAPGDHLFIADAKEEVIRCLHWLPNLPPADLARLPYEVAVGLTLDQLSALSEASLGALPASVQARIAVHPAWSTAAGIDAMGRWAELAVGKHTVRFRFIFAGREQVLTAAGLIAVTSAHGFWLDEQECSQGVWVEVMGSFFSSHNPSAHHGDDLPVDSVTLGECQEFIGAFNRTLADRKTPARVRLPTGAEWQFAASTASEGLAGLDHGIGRPFTQSERAALAWANENSKSMTRATASGERDRWGLLNLLGNVSEWCSDADGSAQQRGGAWNIPLAACIPERSVTAAADARSAAVGLRLVIDDAR